MKKVKTPNTLYVSFYDNYFEFPYGYYFNKKARIKYTDVTNIYETSQSSNDVNYKTLVIIYSDKKYYLNSKYFDEKSFDQIYEILQSKVIGQGEIEYKGIDQKQLMKILIIISIFGFAILLYALFNK